MYFQILTKFLILLVVLNYAYAKLYNTDLLDYVITNKMIFNIFSIIIIIIALFYLFNRDFFLPFLGPAVIPITKIQLQNENIIDVELSGLPPNTRIIYWASNKAEKEYQDPLSAYKNYSNSGIGVTDDTGNVTIKIVCPAPYYVSKFGLRAKLLPRHMHYRYELPKYEGLYSRVYTKNIKSC